jgi:hypothetical protein
LVLLPTAMNIDRLISMKARLILKNRRYLRQNAFVEIVLWDVPAPVRESAHSVKYSLSLVVNEVCVMRYDNEAGKGDHKHVGPVELRYEFRDVDGLMQDFAEDVRRWLDEDSER